MSINMLLAIFFMAICGSSTAIASDSSSGFLVEADVSDMLPLPDSKEPALFSAGRKMLGANDFTVGPVCESQLPATLTCPTGLVIKAITSAFFGRSSSTICPVLFNPGATTNTACAAPGFKAAVTSRCFNKPSCTVPSSLVADPCSGTYKYMTISFTCGSGPVTVGPVCGSASAFLDCPDKFFINGIGIGFWGRADRTTCAPAPPGGGIVGNTGCKAQTFASTVIAYCVNQNNCTVSGGMVADPCPGTYKYMKVIYQCGGQVSLLDYKCLQAIADLKADPTLINFKRCGQAENPISMQCCSLVKPFALYFDCILVDKYKAILDTYLGAPQLTVDRALQQCGPYLVGHH